jgi:hypothetical protein
MDKVSLATLYNRLKKIQAHVIFFSAHTFKERKDAILTIIDGESDREAAAQSSSRRRDHALS